MAATKLTQFERYIGTEAERAALDTTGFLVGTSFLESDTGKMYKWGGSDWTREAILVEGIVLETEALTLEIGVEEGDEV